MAQVQVNPETRLAPVFMKIAYEGNMAGDVAGFPGGIAQALVDRGFAEPYEDGVHDQKEGKVKELGARMEEIATEKNFQRNIAEFIPAEILHEDRARIAEAVKKVLADNPQRFVPSGTGSGTYEQIKERSVLVERNLGPDVVNTADGSAVLAEGRPLNSGEANVQQSHGSDAPEPPEDA